MEFSMTFFRGGEGGESERDRQPLYVYCECLAGNAVKSEWLMRKISQFDTIFTETFSQKLRLVRNLNHTTRSMCKNLLTAEYLTNHTVSLLQTKYRSIFCTIKGIEICIYFNEAFLKFYYKLIYKTTNKNIK